MSIRFTPSSTARRSTVRASSGRSGSPMIPGPVSRIAPKPRRFTVYGPTRTCPARAAPASVPAATAASSLTGHRSG